MARIAFLRSTAIELQLACGVFIWDAQESVAWQYDESLEVLVLGLTPDPLQVAELGKQYGSDVRLLSLSLHLSHPSFLVLDFEEGRFSNCFLPPLFLFPSSLHQHQPTPTQPRQPPHTHVATTKICYQAMTTKSVPVAHGSCHDAHIVNTDTSHPKTLNPQRPKPKLATPNAEPSTSLYNPKQGGPGVGCTESRTGLVPIPPPLPLTHLRSSLKPTPLFKKNLFSAALATISPPGR